MVAKGGRAIAWRRRWRGVPSGASPVGEGWSVAQRCRPAGDRHVPLRGPGPNGRHKAGAWGTRSHPARPGRSALEDARRSGDPHPRSDDHALAGPIQVQRLRGPAPRGAFRPRNRPYPARAGGDPRRRAPAGGPRALGAADHPAHRVGRTGRTGPDQADDAERGPMPGRGEPGGGHAPQADLPVAGIAVPQRHVADRYVPDSLLARRSGPSAYDPSGRYAG